MDERSPYGTVRPLSPVESDAPQEWTPGAREPQPAAAGLNDVAKLAPWVVGLSIAYAVANALGAFALLALPTAGMLALSLLLTPVNYGAIIVGIVWVFLVRRNADRIAGREGSWGPLWGIFGWMIPLANLVIPYLVLSETWRRTTRGEKVPGWFLAWWLPWIGAQVIGYVNGIRSFLFGLQESLRDATEGNPAPDTATWNVPVPDDPVTIGLTVAASVLLLVALPFWLRVVREISARQDALRGTQAAPNGPGAPGGH